MVRVLHLFSNSKWTGPAEPALNLCRTLRDTGVDVHFACARYAGSGFNKVQAVAQHYGIEPLNFLRLTKHRHPVWNWLDVLSLKKHLQVYSYDLIHCHLDNDTDIALDSVRGVPLPVVRSSYWGEGFPHHKRYRRFIDRCSAIIEPSLRAMRADETHFQPDTNRLVVIHGAIDTKRFDPNRPLPDMRRALHLPENAFVLGIVARMQTHRHYNDLFEAFAQFAKLRNEAFLVVIGRGTNQESVGFSPVHKLRIQDKVRFTGYLENDEYVGTLATFDVGLFLTPGTDGTCRAVRELMAMGKPMITSNRGMLDEIVTHERDGLITDGSPEQLLQAMNFIYTQNETRLRYGRSAYQKAHSIFSLSFQAQQVMQLYQRLALAR